MAELLGQVQVPDSVKEATSCRFFHLLEVGLEDPLQISPGVLLLVVGMVQGPGPQVVDAADHVVEGVAFKQGPHELLRALVEVGFQTDPHVEVWVILPDFLQGQEVKG